MGFMLRCVQPEPPTITLGACSFRRGSGPCSGGQCLGGTTKLLLWVQPCQTSFTGGLSREVVDTAGTPAASSLCGNAFPASAPRDRKP